MSILNINPVHRTPIPSLVMPSGFPIQKWSGETPMFGVSNDYSEPLGVIYKKDFTQLSNLNDFTIVEPDATIALSGGFLNLQNLSGNGGFANYIQYNAYGSTQLTKFTIETTFFVRDLTATSFGMALGILGSNTSVNVSYQGFINLANASNKGKVRVYRNGTAIGSFSTALTYSVNDEIKLVFDRNQYTWTVSAYNLTTGSAPVSTSIVSSFDSGVGNTLNTVGKIYIVSSGGIQDLSYLKYSSTAKKNVKCAFVGDSITAGYDATTINNAYANIVANTGSRTYTLLACSASKTNEVLQCMNELLLVNPEYVSLMIGGNDVALGVAEATYKANYISIVNQLKARGIKIIHCLASPRNAFNMNAVLNPFIQTFTSDRVVIGTYFNLKALSGTGLNSVFNSGDNTHPNNAGHLCMGQSFIMEAPEIL